MALASSGRVAKEITTSGDPTAATFFNVSVAVPNSETSQALPSDTKGFIIKTRGSSSLKLSYTVAESGTKFVTISRSAVYNDPNKYTSLTLYFQTSAVDVVEIIAYV